MRFELLYVVPVLQCIILEILDVCDAVVIFYNSIYRKLVRSIFLVKCLCSFLMTCLCRFVFTLCNTRGMSN